MTLDSIAGYKTEKAEVKKIIDMLKNYDEYAKEGIYVPKGLILQGPPGCGKTLFAKAIAGECNVPFFSFSTESDMKDSLESLKELFEKAKEKTPSILYIDEIDKLVSRRYLDSDAVRAAVQLLLSELDGMNNSQGVLVIASTNYYEELPESIIRSGRMDKKISIGAPDAESRLAIIEFYAKDKDALKNISLKNLAVKLEGFSGADIKTLVNNALIEAKSLDRPIEMQDFAKLIDEMQFEDIGRRWKSKQAVTKVLIHEAGHAVVRWALTGKTSSISGIAYAQAAGHTSFDDDFDDFLDDFEELVSKEEETNCSQNKQDCLNSIACYFGGMCSEREFYGNYDSGGISDISAAISTFHRMCDYWFYSADYIDVEPERLMSPQIVNRYIRLRTRVFNKQRRLCERIVKKYRALICMMTEEALKNDDTLSSAQVKDVFDSYLDNKKEIKIKYAHWKPEE
jgi:ATP-dependent Zn protease